MYQQDIRRLQPQHDPRHIEAFMRLQYGALDHLSRETFAREARICAMCVDEGGVANAERLAKSFGL